MTDHLPESETKGQEMGSPSSYASGTATKRRRRAPSHGNPDKTPCVNCGRVPHRRCEHHLCPRCCNVVVKNCPVHIRKSDIKRGAQPVNSADTPRNLSEAVDVYHYEMESVREQHRWMYERKRKGDEEELKQSIKRYKDNATWLQELMSVDLTSEKIAERNRELAEEVDQQQKQVLVLYKNLACGGGGSTASFPKLELQPETHQSLENGKCHKGGEEVSRSPSMSITAVSLPESEWIRMLQLTSQKPSIQLRPS